MLINNLELILCIGQVEYAAVLQRLHLLWVYAAAVGKEGAAAGTQIGQVQDAVGLAQRAMMTADAVFLNVSLELYPFPTVSAIDFPRFGTIFSVVKLFVGIFVHL